MLCVNKIITFQIDRPVKPPRKRNIHGSVANTSKEGKHLIKEQKKKLNKKYERLITALMDRCEENIISVSIIYVFL